jgi:hypothetical protein
MEPEDVPPPPRDVAVVDVATTKPDVSADVEDASPREPLYGVCACSVPGARPLRSCAPLVAMCLAAFAVARARRRRV